MTKLKYTSALVTGASRGIGEATARELSRQGVSVTLAARSIEDCQRITTEITESGGQAIAVMCDVSQYSDVAEAVKAGSAAHGPIDLLINNAGLIDPISRLEDSDPSEWGNVVDVNLKGAYHAIHAVLPGMIQNSSGLIVNISSGAATSALEGWSHYCTTKAAVLSLTRCVHKEVSAQGVRCVGLSPGTVATDMQKSIKKSGINSVSQLDWQDHIPPSWVARTILWLATNAAHSYDGRDFSLKTDEGRRAVGLIN